MGLGTARRDEIGVEVNLNLFSSSWMAALRSHVDVLTEPHPSSVIPIRAPLKGDVWTSFTEPVVMQSDKVATIMIVVYGIFACKVRRLEVDVDDSWQVHSRCDQQCHRK